MISAGLFTLFLALFRAADRDSAELIPKLSAKRISVTSISPRLSLTFDAAFKSPSSISFRAYRVELDESARSKPKVLSLHFTSLRSAVFFDISSIEFNSASIPPLLAHLTTSFVKFSYFLFFILSYITVFCFLYIS